jgi:hypothetical protein
MKHRRAASERAQPGHGVQLRPRRAASERERPGHCVHLRLCEMPLSLREHLLGSLEQS